MLNLYDRFASYRTSQDKKARNIVAKDLSINELAKMTDTDVQEHINRRYKAIHVGNESWILIPNENIKDFEKMVRFID